MCPDGLVIPGPTFDFKVPRCKIFGSSPFLLPFLFLGKDVVVSRVGTPPADEAYPVSPNYTAL